jgi:hypothetical protein
MAIPRYAKFAFVRMRLRNNFHAKAKTLYYINVLKTDSL